MDVCNLQFLFGTETHFWGLLQHKLRGPATLKFVGAPLSQAVANDANFAVKIIFFKTPLSVFTNTKNRTIIIMRRKGIFLTKDAANEAIVASLAQKRDEKLPRVAACPVSKVSRAVARQFLGHYSKFAIGKCKRNKTKVARLLLAPTVANIRKKTTITR